MAGDALSLFDGAPNPSLRRAPAVELANEESWDREAPLGEAPPDSSAVTLRRSRFEFVAPELLLAGLNPNQTAAVLHDGGPLLVVAGAGSGKTRVLTSRIAHLIGVRHVSPFEILAITFTINAAAEMKERMLTQGATPKPTTPEAFDAFIRSEVKKFAPVIIASGAKVN